MCKRISLLTLLGLALLLPVFWRFSIRAESTRPIVGKTVAGFSLKDIEGKKISLGDLSDKKAIVVVFVGTECPINNAYLPRLVEFQKAYAHKGVQFLAINSNRQDTLDRMIEHAHRLGVTFPVLKDESNAVADQLGAQRTPEALVLDGARVIRYRGRIDDQFGIGYKRGSPTTRELLDALDEVLAGKNVTTPLTQVAGCVISRVSKPRESGPVTYAKDVASILQNHCQECHRPGQIGPMPLLTYDDATAWADTIREVLDDGRMPPWFADPHFGKFANNKSLSQKEKETLLAWLDQGTPKGDDRDLPPPKEWNSEWAIGKPDLILSMPNEFEVPADMPKGGVPYMQFTVDTNFKEDRWVERAECRAGALEVVHHIICYIIPPGREFFPGDPDNPVLAGTAPGDMPLILPVGTGKKIPAGSKILFQMHYTPSGRAQKDRSCVAMVFCKEPPKREVISLGIANPSFQIPPGDTNYEVEAIFPFKENARILSYMPHMHLRGKDFKYEAIYPDGKSETLLSIPHYNFNWQSVYRNEKPVDMPKGSKLHCTAHFDNSTKNKNNPDATKPVSWGDQTWEEMMIGWIDFYYDRAIE
jgi:peroxiredoxin